MAGNLIFLRRRIKSVKNTQKLTKAMKTVAAAKLRRSTSELKRSRPYRAKITQLLRETGARMPRCRRSRCCGRTGGARRCWWSWPATRGCAAPSIPMS